LSVSSHNIVFLLVEALAATNFWVMKIYLYEDKKTLPPPVCYCVKPYDMINNSTAARHKRLLSSSVDRSTKKRGMKLRLYL
jgi:hypothetical protein